MENKITFYPTKNTIPDYFSLNYFFEKDILTISLYLTHMSYIAFLGMETFPTDFNTWLNLLHYLLKTR